MAPPRKKAAAVPAMPESQAIREYKVRLPGGLAQWIDEQATIRGVPQNRVFIDTVADHPELERVRKFQDLLDNMEVILARYGSRITLADLWEPLLRGVDEVLAAKPGELPARLDRLRVLRTEIKKFEHAGKE
ncbi:hypothetical protein [Bradyrhizobium sp. USDA 4508]